MDGLERMALRSAGNAVEGRPLSEERAKKTSSPLPWSAWVGVWCARALQQQVEIPQCGRPKSSSRSSAPSNKPANIHAYIACDGPKKGWRNVSALVEWDRRHATIWMSVLAMRTALANLNKSKIG
jgi:hypothetical protein